VSERVRKRERETNNTSEWMTRATTILQTHFTEKEDITKETDRNEWRNKTSISVPNWFGDLAGINIVCRETHRD